MIDAVDISKRLDGYWVLRGLSLRMARGEKTVLSGDSGVGKTTLLRILAGLDTLDSGVVTIDGRMATGADVIIPPHQRGIGFIFQSPALWPHLTVLGNILFTLRGVPWQERRERLQQVLGVTGIEKLGARYPGQLSLGQARRVAIARALAPRPAFLFLDEAFVNLDPKAKRELQDVVLEQVERQDMGMLCVSHDEEEQRYMGDRLLRLEQGALSEQPAALLI